MSHVFLLRFTFADALQSLFFVSDSSTVHYHCSNWKLRENNDIKINHFLLLLLHTHNSFSLNCQNQKALVSNPIYSDILSISDVYWQLSKIQKSINSLPFSMSQWLEQTEKNNQYIKDILCSENVCTTMLWLKRLKKIYRYLGGPSIIYLIPHVLLYIYLFLLVFWLQFIFFLSPNLIGSYKEISCFLKFCKIKLQPCTTSSFLQKIS